jgi:uncharacterized protein (TIGR02147 family)
MKSVFSYIDFRQYIRDFYEEKKQKSRFSYREFSRMAGFTSPVFIKLVIEGKANVSKPSIVKLCNAMELKGDERRYFKNLVLFSRANNINTKINHLNVLKTIQSNLSVNELSDEQFKYFSKWYHPIIKELIDIIEFDGNYEKLSKMVNPPISAKQARQSVELLLQLKLIKKDKNGRFTATHKFVTTESMSIGTLAVRNVQKKMAALASQAIDTVPKENRDISGVSISISEKSMEKIRDELARCRRKILEITAEDDASDRVYRVNLQMFPLSESVPESFLKSKKVKK